jgi:sterol desaturase/sphingolipid hydroxylase (fatty acid hydroxylase superfamily)
MAWLTAFLIALAPTALVTLALRAAEWARGQRGTDWRRNLQAWALNLALALTVLPLFPLWAEGGPSLIDGRKVPFWIGFPVLLLVRDLGEYLYHRAQHRFSFLWAMHSLHHSDPDMMVLTTQRHFWGDQFVKQWTIWPASLLVISPTPALIAAYGLASLWNLFVHSGLPISFGRLSWLLNSPAYHRRHHSNEPAHFDSNFAAIFPIYDVIFGGYHIPDGHPATGLDRQPEHVAELIWWPLVWDRPQSAEMNIAPTIAR